MGNIKIYISLYHQSENEQSDKDLTFEKLRGIGDLLSKLIKEGKVIYIHCTDAISQIPAML